MSGCIACRTTRCGDDRQHCLLIQEKLRAGDALEAFHDGAIFGALLTGVTIEEYQARLEAQYDAATKALAEYCGVVL